MVNRLRSGSHNFSSIQESKIKVLDLAGVDNTLAPWQFGKLAESNVEDAPLVAIADHRRLTLDLDAGDVGLDRLRQLFQVDVEDLQGISDRLDADSLLLNDDVAVDALTVDRGDHVWHLARLGWALHGTTTAMTVPIGEFTNRDAGSVVVWNHDAAGKLFEALAADAPVPAAVLDEQQ